jgi:hypothetical protein
MRMIIARRMDKLPICFDANINMIPVRLRIKLRIFKVFDLKFKFCSMEPAPFGVNYNIYKYS